MANYSVAYAKHATLGVATVDAVTLTTDFYSVEVVNRDTGTNHIYGTVDGSTPTVGGDDTFYVPAGTSMVVRSGSGVDVVKLISAGAAAYSVHGVRQ